MFSEQGDLVAVLFSHPLVASTDPEVTNKILWASQLPQEPMQPLMIEAVLDGTELTVQREVPGGPGPSRVNLPEPGCWRLTLSWSGHQDHMMLQFT